MFLADVVGTVVSPVQIRVLEGRTLLLLRPLSPDGRPTGRTRVGIDVVGAGVGDRVICLDEGNSARQILGDPKAAAKTIVAGVVDYVELAGRHVYDAREREPLARLGAKLVR
jgi:ethanolamine utilization protein EutN